MARIYNNIFVRGLTGTVGGQFVIRKTRYGQTIIANKPMFDESREFTETQLTHQNAFREATTYAKFAKDNPVYAKKAQGTGASTYNVAVADWFSAPQILELDRPGWTGEAGQALRIKAIDDSMVTKVSVAISLNDSILEQGEAVQLETDGTWWIYTLQNYIPSSPVYTLTATAEDLPGNKTSMDFSL